MFLLRLITICCCCLFSAFSLPQDTQDLKAGALFFVSSYSTISTVSAATYCYSTAGTISAPCYKKKRRAIVDSLSEELFDAVSASAVQIGNEDDPLQETEETTLNPRQQVRAEVLLYQYTETITRTTTAYTATRTIVISSCTPTDFL